MTVQIPAEIAAVADYEAFARERMKPAAWAYLNGGAADELTLADNLAAFQRVRLLNRVLEDLGGGHTRLELCGLELDYPILLAPVAYQKLAHPDGELASVLGASAMGAAMVVSTQASVSLEDIAQAAQTPLWFQLYIQPDREFTRELVRRAEAAGYRALVVTVDAPVNGLRNREQRAAFTLPANVEAINLKGMRSLPPSVAQPGSSPLFGSPLLASAPTWKDLEWLQSLTRLPVLVKGVMNPRDAVRAVEQGVAGIVVSNHGGRTLDSLPATLDVLPAIAQAVQGRVPLLLDGGVRRGTDIFKALALGASAVMIGRPYVHGLAVAGASGVAHVLHLLRTELEVAMALTGCARLTDIDASLIWR
ncbi:alpha-hydroxy-acid oxidizing enzyme [Metapseudomonas resinovorans]|uniref:alpha-hydroxy acid oxidase n=1 Tax=Metapseudomonas resinovorans TaxID=53412 RepID=UPI001F448949|nr:alpha-hydroxy acid oxidase [Pseudomonas resinovorans]GLZ84005.1 alpha-hydroxy-acid oxidizing enzyme [Pseudomonas resinovorans]